MAQTASQSAPVVTAVRFRLGTDRYCVDSTRLSSVLGVGDIGTVDSAADPWYAGELSVAGERIRVVDLARVFASPTATIDRPDEPTLLIFRVADEDGALYGWLVDDVERTERIEPTQIEPNGNPLSFITGQVVIDGSPYLWLDEQAIHD